MTYEEVKRALREKFPDHQLKWKGGVAYLRDSRGYSAGVMVPGPRSSFTTTQHSLLVSEHTNRGERMVDKVEYWSDYAQKPIGGRNPYYCCAGCGRSVPEINGDVNNHEEQCPEVARFRDQKERAALVEENKRLKSHIKKLEQFIPCEVVECRGDKCREPWCVSCFGQENAEAFIAKVKSQLLPSHKDLL